MASGIYNAKFWLPFSSRICSPVICISSALCRCSQAALLFTEWQLTFMEQGDPGLRKENEASDRKHFMQVCVTLDGMQPEQNYWLALPKGSTYSSAAGALQENLFVQFISVLPFTTPLKDSSSATAKDFNQAQGQGANSRNLELFMPHGLDDAQTVGNGLPQRIRLTDHGIPFESYSSIKGITGTQEPVVLEFDATAVSK